MYFLTKLWLESLLVPQGANAKHTVLIPKKISRQTVTHTRVWHSSLLSGTIRCSTPKSSLLIWQSSHRISLSTAPSPLLVSRVIAITTMHSFVETYTTNTTRTNDLAVGGVQMGAHREIHGKIESGRAQAKCQYTSLIWTASPARLVNVESTYEINSSNKCLLHWVQDPVWVSQA